MPSYFKPINPNLSSSRSGNNYSIPFDTITYNINLDKHALDVVICIDSVFDNTQIALADNYIDSVVARLQTVKHYYPRFKYFNIYRLAKHSNEQGATWVFQVIQSLTNATGVGSILLVYHVCSFPKR